VTFSLAMAAMLVLLAMNNRIMSYWRCCPVCGGRERHHATCPYRKDS
jgi:hypothetical protein